MNHRTLFKEYVWLVHTIAKYRRITFEELRRLWGATYMSEGTELSRSTFNRHKEAIEDIFGIFIECDRRDGYKYYISNAEDLESHTIQNWMLSTMTVNTLLASYKGLHNNILLEPVPSAKEYLEEIMEAMKQHRKLCLVYQKYSNAPSPERLVAPYCVKLYRRRWYMLARVEDGVEDGSLRSFSLDRIKHLALHPETFEPDPHFDANLYFKDFVGIMGADAKKERIVIRAYRKEKYYLRDLPLHPSQREITEEEYLARQTETPAQPSRTPALQSPAYQPGGVLSPATGVASPSATPALQSTVYQSPDQQPGGVLSPATGVASPSATPALQSPAYQSPDLQPGGVLSPAGAPIASQPMSTPPVTNPLSGPEESALFEYYLVPTADFFTQLLSRGGEQRVLEPQWIAQRLHEMHRAAAALYEQE